MKKIFLAIILISIYAGLFGQNSTNAETRSFIAQLTSSKSNIDKLSLKYPLQIFGNVYYISALARLDKSTTNEKLEAQGIIIRSKIKEFASLYIPVSLLQKGKKIAGINYFEIAARITPTLSRALHDTRVDSVHMGYNLPKPFTGKDVLIGITDWGFDYTNPMFYDTTLSHTRIVKAWDQFRLAGPPPSGYNYGTEITGEIDLLLAQCDTFNIYEYATHGSHVAGIAGGSGAGTIYRGAAFEAGYLMATFLVDAAAVIDAYTWMKEYAESVNKRLVINQSWGLYYMGNLDGTSILSQVIDQMSNEGVVFVSSAGNNGDVNFHIRYDANGTDTLKTMVGFDSYSYYSNMWGQCITMWGNPGTGFSASICVLNTSNVILHQTPFYYTDSLSIYLEDTIFINSDTILYNIAADSANPLNQRPHMQMRIANRNTAYKIGLMIYANPTTVHLWNIIELTNGVGNWGSSFTAPVSGWTAGDHFYSIGEPACAESIISVASYSAEYQSTSGLPLGGGISSFSSFGPTIDERMKPDIAAPGSNVCSSVSSFSSQTFSGSSVIASVDFNSRTYKFVKFSGTSMSSPMITGITALMLQADSSLTPSEIKNILKETAREDNRTGDIPDTGSTRWGWGKVNALHAIYRTLGINQVNETAYDLGCVLYPNPAKDELWLVTPGETTPDRIEIFTMEGKLILSIDMPGTGTPIDLSMLDSGLYLVKARLGNNEANMKLIKL